MSDYRSQNMAVWGVLLPVPDTRESRTVCRRLSSRGRSTDEGASVPPALQEALARFAGLFEPARFLMVLRTGQQGLIGDMQPGQIPGRIIEQPADRGTAPELFLAASYIRVEDPDAIAVMLPSEFLPFSTSSFGLHLKQAKASLERHPDSVILLAASPVRPDSDLPWIDSGGPLEPDGDLRSIRRFYHRASRSEAERFFKRGLLASTGILVARVNSLWKLGLEFFPAMMSRFEDLTELLRLVSGGKVSPELEQLALRDVYRGLESLDFARMLLQKALDRFKALPLRASQTDWGHVGISTRSSDSVPPRLVAV